MWLPTPRVTRIASPYVYVGYGATRLQDHDLVSGDAFSFRYFVLTSTGDLAWCPRGAEAVRRGRPPRTATPASSRLPTSFARRRERTHFRADSSQRRNVRSATRCVAMCRT
jgi:hypothetical protein